MWRASADVACAGAALLRARPRPRSSRLAQLRSRALALAYSLTCRDPCGVLVSTLRAHSHMQCPPLSTDDTLLVSASPTTGGDDDSLNPLEPHRQRSRDDDYELVKSLQERLRKYGARVPDRHYVQVALNLARVPLFKPDKDWWDSTDVPEGGARTRVRGYKQRILDEQLLTKALEPPAPPPRETNPRRFFSIAADGWYPFLIAADDISKDGVIAKKSILKEGIMRLRVVGRPGTHYLWVTPAATGGDLVDDDTVRFGLEDAYRMATAAADMLLPLPPPLPLPLPLPAPPPRQRSRDDDDDELVASLQKRLRKDGARAPDWHYVKVALELARVPSFKPVDKDWWDFWDVPDSGARTRVRGYKQRILDEQLLTKAPEPPPRLPARQFFSRDGWYPFLITADDIAERGVIDRASVLKAGIMQLRVFGPVGIRYLWLTDVAKHDEAHGSILVRFLLEHAYRMATAAANVSL